MERHRLIFTECINNKKFNIVKKTEFTVAQIRETLASAFSLEVELTREGGRGEDSSNPC